MLRTLKPGKKARVLWRIALAALLLALLWQLLLILPGMLRLRTYVAEWGELKEESILPAAIFRHEILYRSPGSFRFLAVAAEGSRVPKDELVAFLVSPEIAPDVWQHLEQSVTRLRDWPSKVAAHAAETAPSLAEISRQYSGLLSAVRAGQAGVFSTISDGLEELFVPEDAFAGRLNLPLSEKRSKPRDSSSLAMLKPGDIMFRMVDNHQLLLVIELPRDCAAYAAYVGNPPQSISVALPEAEEYFRADITSFDPTGSYMILRMNSFAKKFLNERFINVRVIWTQKSGLLIPKAALTKREGIEGVIVDMGNRRAFQPVKVLAASAKRAIITGIKPGTLIRF
jgi:hypothetical protein